MSVARTLFFTIFVCLCSKILSQDDINKNVIILNNFVTYVQVIVPLKLEWEPYYSVPDDIKVAPGDRVSVLFSGKEYMAVVSRTNVEPGDSLQGKNIYPILDKVTDLPAFTALEISFWRMLAQYYMCTVGEVYKSVYFLDQKAPRKWVAKEWDTPPVPGNAGGTVLLQSAPGADRTGYYLEKAAEVIKEGRSVLYLVPEIALSRQLEQRVGSVFPEMRLYHSSLTPAKRRDAVLEARSGKAMLVLGTRSALMLPFKCLGLIIVEQEQDPTFKQESPAPRYYAREASIMLSSLYGAKVILGSSTPSLESQYNAEIGLFTRDELKENFRSVKSPEITIIDTVSERRKRGMVGDISLKLLALAKEAVDAGSRVLAVSWQEDVQIPGADIVTPSAVKNMQVDGYGLIAVLEADRMLGRQDFRSDERALQLLRRLSADCPLVIQTKEAGHRVFSALARQDNGIFAAMLEERRQFGYPPFTRLVLIQLKDVDHHRQALRSRLLGNRIREAVRAFSDPLVLGPEQGEIRVFFKRDRNLSKGKEALYREVTSFESQYSCHITIDVDPA